MSVFLVLVAFTATLLHFDTYLVVHTKPSDGNVVQMWRTVGAAPRRGWKVAAVTGQRKPPEDFLGTAEALQQPSPGAARSWCSSLLLSQLCAALK